jgi:hypothetical protein
MRRFSLPFILTVQAQECEEALWPLFWSTPEQLKERTSLFHIGSGSPGILSLKTKTLWRLKVPFSLPFRRRATLIVRPVKSLRSTCFCRRASGIISVDAFGVKGLILMINPETRNSLGML